MRRATKVVLAVGLLFVSMWILLAAGTTWLTDEVYRLLEKHRVALCLAESDKFEVPEVVTSDFVYVRLRKPDYSPEERAEVAERVRRQLADGRDVYCFFKHEDTPAGAQYAEELQQAAR